MTVRTELPPTQTVFCIDVDPPSKDAETSWLGNGFNRLNFSVIDKALDIPNSEAVGPFDVVSQFYYIKYFEDKEQLISSLSLNAGASLSGVLGSCSLEVSFSKHIQIDDQSIFLYATFEQSLFETRVQAPRLRQEALNELARPEVFLPKYGDKFIRSIRFGKKLYLLFQFNRHDLFEETSLRVDLRAKYGQGTQFSSSFALMEDIKSTTQQTEFQTYAFSFGSKPGLIHRPDEIWSTVDSFLKDDAVTPFPLDLEQSYYNSCVGVESKRVPNLNPQIEVLDGLGKQVESVSQARLICAEAAVHQEYYENSDPKTLEGINSSLDRMEYDINSYADEIIQFASSSVAEPQPPDFSGMNLPKLRMPVYIKLTYSGTIWAGPHGTPLADAHSGPDLYEWLENTSDDSIFAWIGVQTPFPRSAVDIRFKASGRHKDGPWEGSERSLIDQLQVSPDNGTYMTGFSMGLGGSMSNVLRLEYCLEIRGGRRQETATDGPGLGPFIGDHGGNQPIIGFRLRLSTAKPIITASTP